MKKEYYNFNDLIEIVAYLRSENGCPWDKVQTHKSLKKYLIEESYETLEAIDLENDDKLKEELGDVLLQIMLHSQIGVEDKSFNIHDVIHGIAKKMVNRHTHVFGNDVANTPEEVLVNWNKVKNKEKGLKKISHILDDIPKTLPSLMKSYEIQNKAAKVGFDWEDKQGAFDKTREEIEEFIKASDNMDQDEKESEMGDILFSLVNVCRFANIDAEVALQRTNNKFINRFKYMETYFANKNINMSDLTLEQLDVIWEEAKNEIG